MAGHADPITLPVALESQRRLLITLSDAFTLPFWRTHWHVPGRPGPAQRSRKSAIQVVRAWPHDSVGNTSNATAGTGPALMPVRGRCGTRPRVRARHVTLLRIKLNTHFLLQHCVVPSLLCGCLATHCCSSRTNSTLGVLALHCEGSHSVAQGHSPSPHISLLSSTERGMLPTKQCVDSAGLQT